MDSVDNKEKYPNIKKDWYEPGDGKHQSLIPHYFETSSSSKSVQVDRSSPIQINYKQTNMYLFFAKKKHGLMTSHSHLKWKSWQMEMK